MILRGMRGMTGRAHLYPLNLRCSRMCRSCEGFQDIRALTLLGSTRRTIVTTPGCRSWQSIHIHIAVLRAWVSFLGVCYWVGMYCYLQHQLSSPRTTTRSSELSSNNFRDRRRRKPILNRREPPPHLQPINPRHSRRSFPRFWTRSARGRR